MVLDSQRLEQRYWENHPRELAKRLRRRRRFRDVCHKHLSIWGEIAAKVIIYPILCVCACFGEYPLGEWSPAETPSTPSPPPTPSLKPGQILALAPKPLQHEGHRNRLSLGESSQATFAQTLDLGRYSSTSPLLRLPRDIRIIIWELVLCGHVFHIGWSPGRLHHTTCTRCNASEFGRGPDETCWPYSLEPSLHRRRNHAQDIARPSVRRLGLLMACRATYVLFAFP